MTEKHVGKKRRKEVREAINMKRQIRKSVIFLTVVFVIAVLVVLGTTALTVVGILDPTNMLIQAIPIIFVFIVLMVLSMRMNDFWALRKQYKEHCLKYNITKEDMKALASGDL